MGKMNRSPIGRLLRIRSLESQVASWKGNIMLGENKTWVAASPLTLQVQLFAQHPSPLAWKADKAVIGQSWECILLTQRRSIARDNAQLFSTMHALIIYLGCKLSKVKPIDQSIWLWLFV